MIDLRDNESEEESSESTSRSETFDTGNNEDFNGEEAQGDDDGLVEDASRDSDNGEAEQGDDDGEEGFPDDSVPVSDPDTQSDEVEGDLGVGTLMETAEEHFRMDPVEDARGNRNLLRALLKDHEPCENFSEANWKRCCRFFGDHPVDKKRTTDLIQLHGMKEGQGLYPYHALAVMRFFEKGIKYGGLFCCDQMGVGKVRYRRQSGVPTWLI